MWNFGVPHVRTKNHLFSKTFPRDPGLDGKHGGVRLAHGTSKKYEKMEPKRFQKVVLLVNMAQLLASKLDLGSV